MTHDSYSDMANDESQASPLLKEDTSLYVCVFECIGVGVLVGECVSL